MARFAGEPVEAPKASQPKGPRFVGTPVDADTDEGFSFLEMAKNVPSSAVQFGKDVATPFMNPIDTAQSVYNLALGVASKAIPGEQDSEAYADQMGQFIKDRYGSWDAFKDTAEKDPVGVLADVSALFTGGSLSAVKAGGKVGKLGRSLNKVGKAIDPVNLGAKTTAYGAGKLIPKSVPPSMYESAAKFSTTMTPDERRALSQTALREGVMPTSKGLGQVDLRISALGKQIDNLVESATDSGVKIPKERIYRHLSELKQEVGGAKINAPQDIKRIDKLVDTFDEHLQKLGKDSLTPSELQAFKRDAYQRINWDTRQGQASYTKEQASKAMARAAKEELEQVAPDIRDLNRRQGDLLELRPNLERSAARIENRDIIGLGMPMKGAAGGVVGGPAGAAAATGAALLDTPRVKARMALMAEALRNRDAGSLLQNRTAPLIGRDLLMYSGRAQQSQEENPIPRFLRAR